MQRTLCTALMLLVPSMASAAVIETWAFAGEKEVSGVTRFGDADVQLIPEGMLVRSRGESQITRDLEEHAPIDAMEVHFVAIEPFEATLIWHPKGTPPAHAFKSQVTFPAAQFPQVLSLPLSKYPMWDPNTDRLGFVFPAGSQIVIDRIEFHHWTVWDRVVSTFLTFWTFDEIRPYSVNFLWGPLLTFDPLSRQHLFSQFPPLAISANWVFIVALLVGLVVVAVVLTAGSDVWKRRMIPGFLFLLAISWILYDIRMGSEFIAAFAHDISTYHSEEKPRQRFRDRGPFYGFAEAVAKVVEGESEFVFAASSGWPFTSIMKYTAYPSRPIPADQMQPDTDTWVFWDRPDISVNGNGELVIGSDVISVPGKVLHEFEEGTFIFRTGP